MRKTLGWIALGAMLAAGCAMMEKISWMLSSNPLSADPESPARGRLVYAGSCARCHGSEGRGDGPDGANLSPPPTDLVQYRGQHSDSVFAAHVAHGKTGSDVMPRFDGVLSDTEIWDVTNYVYLRLPGEDRRVTPGG